MLKRRLKEPFGKAGLIVAAIALIFALTGGALAATGNNPLASSSKAKPGPRGKTGKTGKTGPAGLTGPAGTAGPAGPAGAAGKNGTNGTNGTNGKSITVGNATAGECGEGGATVEAEGTPASKKHVCNGSPWTAGGTLPKGATETGSWSFETKSEGGSSPGSAETSISFPIPLPAPLEAGGCHSPSGEGCQVHYVTVVETLLGDAPPECPGFYNEPKAQEGYLCVYGGTFNIASAAESGNGESPTLIGLTKAGTMTGADVAGMLMRFSIIHGTPAGEPASGRGTFAVTAE